MNVRMAGLVVLGLAGLVGGSAKGQMVAASAPAAVAACGSLDAKFDVKEEPEPTTSHAGGPQAAVAVPDGKAMVYLVEDIVHVPFSTTVLRLGIDGKWVGATKNLTYVGIAVDPGVHHVCVSLQGMALYQLQKGIVLRQLTVEAGKTYYLRAQEVQGRDVLPLVFVEPVDEDEGQFLLETTLPADSHAK
jgi:hypothetical protein